MIDLTGVQHHPAIEEIVNVLCNKTQNTDRGFFRVEAAYFLAKMASSMGATIVTADRGDIPVNIYALALATSGYGKGHSVNIVENDFLKGFKKRFMEDTMPVIADANLWKIANERAAKNGTDQQEEYDKVSAEYRRAGAFPFTFDSGTAPAVKQLRQKLLLATCGSINLQIDEIGSNLIETTEVLTLFLELYDQGLVKQKLTKNTAENTRGEELDGKTPTNMLLFGTPSKLLDGGQTEDAFYSFLDTGYARRCLFGIGQPVRMAHNSQTPEEIYDRLTQPGNQAAVSKWANHFHSLADAGKFGWRMVVERDVGIELIAYKAHCEKQAEEMAEHEEIRKAEISHRYFKALKLAGALAFVDESVMVDMDHLKQAILLVEESGAAFQTILTREKAYVKLAKYIASVGTEVTHADLVEALPFYKSGNAFRNEIMTLATAWGYKQHIIIKKTFADGIEFFRGETLKETNTEEMLVSYSDNFAYDYVTERAPFEQLHQMTQAKGMHWANHAFKRGHRAEENVIPGFNMIVIDVDGGVSLAAVHELMKDYKFMTYTTKRHTDEENRFRLMLPMNYELQLDADEYKEFMNNVMQWLPFTTDESANQRSKKWECYDGDYFVNPDGVLLDVRDFIPRTTKNEQFQASMQAVQNLDNLERWFAQRMAQGNRNNNMLRFAMALVDSGMDFNEVSQQVHAFNKKLSTPLDSEELNTTVLVSVAKKYTRQ
ncbi:putative DNA primase [Achromobacter phage vB_AxyP_19-32_Axy04]|uniref:Putative DNA primase n=1 Tax=Achromobacter phage vB_AxyP_19-32_Axy04 TaxID=2591039 RepID=A0A514CTE7_9CAUD|nr:DNA primase [Achromobacter phage vB_AxyP_19-32_Axy04]QDH83736.1 putative DNA primase [Achromobacter phage vB_AxyP_19-32_Axy04]